MLDRRAFLESCAAGLSLPAFGTGLRVGWSTVAAGAAEAASGVPIRDVQPGEDVFAWLRRVNGRFDPDHYRKVLGAANEFKEGDGIIGVAAADDESRHHARTLLSRTRLSDLDAHPPLEDGLFALLKRTVDRQAAAQTASFTLGQLKEFLLTEDEAAIQRIMPGLSSDVIACVVRLMTDAELIAVGAKVFNPLPGSRIGAKGYLGARIQPNSPTDHPDDIRWQVFDGFAYAVGDVLLGTNPVSSDPEQVLRVERALQDILVTFGIDDLLPHCVLAHIDVQAEVEQRHPGSTELWFQSIAGNDAANATFDISVAKMLEYAAQRTGRFGLYFETGQGADFTNGHGHGCDMVLLESRKYGFARALSRKVAAARAAAGHPGRPWVHLNDVAGFIGPEVFRSREQLVRCCLEDIVMGKLHGLTLGLDVCSTLHMDVSLDDLDWCLDRIMPACPAYLMALPTKIDPMLGYLTTGYQDHVRLRSKFGLKVNDAMWRFFQTLGVIDADSRPTEHFGNPAWVYRQYRHRQGDTRPDEELFTEAREQIAAVRRRGLFIAEGFGRDPSELEPGLKRDIERIYADAKQSIWAELEPGFVDTVPDVLPLATRSLDRTDYILHPETGERLSDPSTAAIQSLRQQHGGRFDVQIVISDGLNALSIMDPGHLGPFLKQLRENLARAGFRPAPEHVLLTSGRVRAGYRIGELLFGGLPGRRAVLHVIGERPGSGHRTFSVYLTNTDGSVWGVPGRVDHNITKVVSGIAATALDPRLAADETVRLLRTTG